MTLLGVRRNAHCSKGTAIMPLTSKGRKIKAAMVEQYGSKEGTSVFYASRNKGKITGVDKAAFRDALNTQMLRGVPTKDALGIALKGVRRGS